MVKADTAIACYFCGEGTIEPRDLRGLLLSYRGEPEVLVEGDVIVPTCDRCGESLLNDESSANLDSALAPAYQRLRRNAGAY